MSNIVPIKFKSMRFTSLNAFCLLNDITPYSVAFRLKKNMTLTAAIHKSMAKKYGINYKVAPQILKKIAYPSVYKYNGIIYKSKFELCKSIGISRNRVTYSLKHGSSLIEAVDRELFHKKIEKAEKGNQYIYKIKDIPIDKFLYTNTFSKAIINSNYY